MEVLTELDKICLKYHDIDYLVVAYYLFYGKYPNFDNGNNYHFKKEFYVMMILLGEYDIFDDEYNDFYTVRYSEEMKIPYSEIVRNKLNMLFDRIKKVELKEEFLKELCSDSAVTSKEKKGIREIRNIIDEQMKLEQFDDLSLFLEQLANIIYYRNSSFTTLCSVDDSYDVVFSKLVKDLNKMLGYPCELLRERLVFLNSKLKLKLKNGNCSISLDRVINYSRKRGLRKVN